MKKIINAFSNQDHARVKTTIVLEDGKVFQTYSNQKHWEECDKTNTIEITKEDIKYYQNNGGAIIDRPQGIVFNLDVEFEKDKKITSTIIMSPEDTNIEFLEKVKNVLFYNAYKELVELGILKEEKWTSKYPDLGIRKPLNGTF